MACSCEQQCRGQLGKQTTKQAGVQALGLVVVSSSEAVFSCGQHIIGQSGVHLTMQFDGHVGCGLPIKELVVGRSTGAVVRLKQHFNGHVGRHLT